MSKNDEKIHKKRQRKEKTIKMANKIRPKKRQKTKIRKKTTRKIRQKCAKRTKQEENG